MCHRACRSLRKLFSWQLDCFPNQNISNSELCVPEIKDVILPPQLPHGLPPTSLSLETEVEKLFLQDPSWLPIHDTDFAFQKFPKYVFLWTVSISLCKIMWNKFVSYNFFFLNFFIDSSCCAVILLRVTERKVNVDSLLHCAPSALHSGLSVVRDPTTGMLMDFTEVGHKHTAPFFCVCFNQCCKLDTSRVDTRHFIGLFPPRLPCRFYWKTPACLRRIHFHYNGNQDLQRRAFEEVTLTTPSFQVEETYFFYSHNS